MADIARAVPGGRAGRKVAARERTILRRVLHAVCAIGFAGMTYGVLGGHAAEAKGGLTLDQIVFLATVASVAFLALVARLWVRRTAMTGATDILFVVLTLAGAPGLLLLPTNDLPSRIVAWLASLTYAWALYFWMPRAVAPDDERYLPIVTGWLMRISALVMAGGVVLVVRVGPAHAIATRLNGVYDGWFHSNTSGYYSAALLVVASASPWLKGRRRRTTIAAAAMFLVVTQSRTSIIAALAALAVLSFLSLRRSTARQMARYSIMVAVAVVVLAATGASLMQSQSVQGMLNRQSRGDYATGRSAGIQARLALLNKSPFVGFGARMVGMRMENGYLSLTMETGALGLTAYLVFLGACLWRVWRACATASTRTERQEMQLILCLGVFIAIHAMGENTQLMKTSAVVSSAWILMIGRFTYISGIARSRRPVPGAARRGMPVEGEELP